AIELTRYLPRSIGVAPAGGRREEKEAVTAAIAASTVRHRILDLAFMVQFTSRERGKAAHRRGRRRSTLRGVPEPRRRPGSGRTAACARAGRSRPTGARAWSGRDAPARCAA